MNQHDPTSAESNVETSLAEITVDEVAFQGALDATNVEKPQTGAGAPAEAAALPGPIPPIPIPKRAVSGRYRGATGPFQLELRVDVDRVQPMKRISGDFFQTSGATTSYVGSFVVNSPVVAVTPTKVTISGTGSYTFNAGAPVIRVSIQRRLLLQPQAPAIVEFFTTHGTPGAHYVCQFESIYFRTVRIETDRVSDVTTPVFQKYDTGSQPSGGPARTLSVVGAYAEAGIQMIPTTGADVINIAEANAGSTWSNAELHASMEHHFTLWRDLPQWAVWEMVGRLHDLGPGLYGIMFDQQGKQRQGCAVFHEGIGGTTLEQLRLQLYTYVHELGHCFNLLHSWQKSFAVPPKTNRPAALSWMNYPWYYPSGGPTAFWNNFPFQFDAEELIHLRHGFRNDVIMGANNFAVGSSLGREIMAEAVRDDSGLDLRISTHQKSFALGEPVVLQLELAPTTLRTRKVHDWLHPNYGLVKIAICRPGGEIAFYEPLIDHLVGESSQDLGPNDTVKDSAYIGFGKGGLYFEHPGRYQIRAVYGSADGSQIVSNLLDVRVRYPVTQQEEEVAELFIGDEQGALLYLLGSDSETLRNGNAAFDEVLERYPKSHMATYARLVKGFNAARTFKLVMPSVKNGLTVRKPRTEESVAMLSAVVGAKTLDAVSNEQTEARLAAIQRGDMATTRPRPTRKPGPAEAR